MKYATLSSRPVEFSASGGVNGSGSATLVRNKTITYNRICSTGFESVATAPMFPGRIIWCGTYFVIAFNTTTAYKSVDGVSWESLTLPQAFNGGDNVIHVSGNKAFMSNNAGAIYTTDGGSTWYASTLNGFSGPDSIGYTGNTMSTDGNSTIISQRYVSGVAHNNMAYSTDSGATWNLTAALPNSYAATGNDYTWYDGNYFLLTRYGLDGIWYSSNGISWSYTSMPPMGGISSGVKLGGSNGYSYLLTYGGTTRILNTNNFTLTNSPHSIYNNAGYRGQFTKDSSITNLGAYFNGSSAYFLITEPLEYCNYKTPIGRGINFIAASPNYILGIDGSTSNIWRKAFPLARDTRTVTY